MSFNWPPETRSAFLCDTRYPLDDAGTPFGNIDRVWLIAEPPTWLRVAMHLLRPPPPLHF